MPEFTALENVALPAMIRGKTIKANIAGKMTRGQKARDRARDILKVVGMERRMSHRPGELSGGESQRVAIARALINEPEILLCDEPTGNLDSTTSESIYELLFDIKAKSNAALVIVTHNEHITSRMDEVIRLKDGKIA